MSIYVQPPRPVFFDSAGSPLENGYIWIGAANLPPQTNPVAVFWDSALTQPAAQPIRTVNGYPSNAGAPSAIYTAAACSILVQNKNGSLVYSTPEFDVGIVGSGDIVTSMLANNAVTTAKIADGAATLAKLDRTGLAGQVLTGQGAGVAPVWTAGLNTARIDVASAATINLTTSAPNTRNINITGTTTITSFAVVAGSVYFVRFAGALTLTNSANLVTQTGSNISTQPGDTCILRATADNVVEVLSYSRSVQPFLGVAISTTSGTAIDIVGIPSTARRVTLMFNGVSTNGTSRKRIQIGAATIETSGYVGGNSFISNSGAGTSTISAGFDINDNQIASVSLTGAYDFRAFGSNLWIVSGGVGDPIGLTAFLYGGKSLSGPLERIRLTTVNGTDAYDAGSVNVSWGET
jgi:hypothetical protein